MNEGTGNTETKTLNLTSACKATRFAVACVVLGFSYLAIRSSLGISSSHRLFVDMLGESETLPVVTAFVFRARPMFLMLSFCVPVACLAFLFDRDIARSLYCIGILVLVSIVECIILFHALSSPIFRIAEKMQGAGQ